MTQQKKSRGLQPPASLEASPPANDTSNHAGLQLPWTEPQSFNEIVHRALAAETGLSAADKRIARAIAEAMPWRHLACWQIVALENINEKLRHAAGDAA